MKEQTRLVHGGMELFEDYEYVNPPVYRASTVLHPSFEDMIERAMAEMTMTNKKPTYGTYGSPTHHAFYRALCALEGPKAVGAWSYPTGLAACTIPLTAFLKAGDHCLLVDTIYGPTREYFDVYLRRFGIETEFFDPMVGSAIDKHFKPNTRLVFMETPGSHTFELMDVPAIAQKCQEHNIVSVIDNTWATALNFKPMEAGVDVVIHAATKYIAGHSDVTMGVVICNEKTWPAVYRTSVQNGQTTSCDDIYLAYRGLHSMAARMKQAVASAYEIVDWLLKQPQVERVLWPALPTDPSYEIFRRDFKGPSALFAVLFKPEYAGKLAPMINALQLFGRGYSWGGYESLLIGGYGTRTVRPMPFDRMVRISVGLEDLEDLIGDLKQAMQKIK